HPIAYPIDDIGSFPRRRAPATAVAARAIQLGPGTPGVEDVLDVVERLRAVPQVSGVLTVVPREHSALAAVGTVPAGESERITRGVDSAVTAEDDRARKIGGNGGVGGGRGSSEGCQMVVRRSRRVDLRSGREILLHPIV